MSNPEIIKFEDSIEALLDDRRAVWLTVDQICKLLELKERVVRHHIANWKDIDPEAASKGVQHFDTPSAGGIQSTAHYNVDFLIYIAYRMNRKDLNARVLAFRRWVASIVDRYLRGDLRQAEKHTYEDVKAFITQMSDYDKNTATAQRYFATVQNKLLFAVTGKTAAELVLTRANRAVPNMGLQCWRGKNVTQADAVIGKNYLSGDELNMLHGLVQVIAFSLKQYTARQATMAQWERYIDQQIELTFARVLIGTGKYSHEAATAHAKREYDAYKRMLGDGQ